MSHPGPPQTTSFTALAFDYVISTSPHDDVWTARTDQFVILGRTDDRCWSPEQRGGLAKTNGVKQLQRSTRQIPVIIDAAAFMMSLWGAKTIHHAATVRYSLMSPPKRSRRPIAEISLTGVTVHDLSGTASSSPR